MLNAVSCVCRRLSPRHLSTTVARAGAAVTRNDTTVLGHGTVDSQPSAPSHTVGAAAVKFSDLAGRTGGEIFHEMMLRHGVKHVFGYPGGAILPVFDAIFESEQFQLILPRHEQGAGHMAEGYARATGKPGVVLVTSGPGATNMITPMQDALSDGVPMVVFSGQVPTSAIGTDAFQEADIIGISRACTKWNVMVTSIEELPRRINEAFAIATSGRPGPVLVDLPKDVTVSVLAREVSAEPIIPAVPKKSTAAAHLQKSIESAAELINQSRRPIIYAGHGVISSESGVALLRELATTANIPVVTTLQGLGAFDENHPLSLHMLGMHGAAYANLSVQNADVLIAVGARFDDRVTGTLSKFAPAAKRAAQEGNGGIIHFEVLPKNINKVVNVDIPIEGDLATSLAAMMPMIRHRKRADWLQQVQGWKTQYPFRYDSGAGSGAGQLALKPQEVVEELNRQLGSQLGQKRAIITTGVGQHQMWAAQFVRWRHPRSFISSGGLGTMGFGLPAAIGAKIAFPDRWVVDIDGDASFAMTGMELMTASEFDVGVKVLILNNGFQGMVRQWQDLFYSQRYSSTKMTNPDFVMLAESMHCTGLRIRDRSELREGIREFLFADLGNNKSGRRPVLLDCHVEAEEHVYPMVPAGKALHEMVLGANVPENITGSNSKK